ncbi:MAG TPA: hypothetical protein VG146_13680 [Verrucomicrobiae bacterium]|nr:hypothetical protein [Verrucomicrobiae bacterium]
MNSPRFKWGAFLTLGILSLAAAAGVQPAAPGEPVQPRNSQQDTPIARNRAASPPSPSAVSRNLTLWDTFSPASDNFDPERRVGWNVVPGDLLLLEKDRLKASSDPGYYGRDYSFKGDAVVETPALIAAFCSIKGCVRLFAKAGGGRISELSPVPAAGAAITISRVEIVRNADDDIVLEATFSGAGPLESTCIFSFDRTGILEIKLVANLDHLRLSAPIAYGVFPAFIGDDLIYGGSEGLGTNTAAVPAENMFLGLLRGEDTELVLTWPQGEQRVSLQLAEEQGEEVIQSIDFNGGGQNLYLAALSAPGIWHKETLTPDFLERDVRIQWRPPFAARWKTQLYEEDLKTSYAFRESKGTIWRGVAGSYDYPVWFTAEGAFYHLSKKVQPKGESIIYFLEGRDTPLTVSTPAELLNQTLGWQAAEPILDLAGRKLRTHHRRGAVGVRRACTCGCTEAIQAIFEAGEEARQKDEIQGELDDMIYFVHRHVDRINQYRQFAASLLKLLDEKKRSAPELEPFIERVEEIARQIPQECEVQKENMKDFGYADELSRKTMALTAGKDPAHLGAYMELLNAWRAMGGAQDYVLAKCHTITRGLCQEAGYGCAAMPGAVPLARQVRADCRHMLRNPDGYEIWPDY